MKRLLSSIFAAALLAAFSAPVAAAPTPMAHMMMGKKHTCPVGKTWVKGYETKAGKYVKGYCRKPMSKMKM